MPPSLDGAIIDTALLALALREGTSSWILDLLLQLL